MRVACTVDRTADRALDPTIDAQWTAWWGAGAWHRLDPAIRTLAREAVRRIGWVDADTAEDIAAYVVVRCWTYRTVPDSPMAFVLRCTRNRSVDHHKRRDTRSRVSSAAYDLDEAVDPRSETSDESVIAPEDLARLKLAIRDLPDLLRRPFVLHEFHRRDCVSLATQFGTTEGAIRMRLVRARRMLGGIYRALPAPSATEAAALLPTVSHALTVDPTTAPRTKEIYFGTRTVRAMVAPDLAAPIDGTMPTSLARVTPGKTLTPIMMARAPIPPRRGRPFLHRCRCGDPACAVIVAHAQETQDEPHHATA